MADVGDKKQVKEKKAVHQLAREKEVAELHGLLETYGGRAFLWRLLEKCGIYKASGNDPYDVFRGEGKRDIGLWALEEVFNANVEAYTMMRNEAVSREAANGGNNG